MKIFFFPLSVLLFIVLLFDFNQSFAVEFSDINIEEDFKPYLLSNKLLMEITGSKVIRLEKGKSLVLSVGSVVLTDNKAKTRIDAEKVCKSKALAYVVGEKYGVNVFNSQTLAEATQITLDNNQEKGKSVSEFLEITKSQTSGMVKGMPPVGSWMSKDKTVFYVAIGVFLDKKGEITAPVKFKK